MRPLVTVVICVLVALPAAASASTAPRNLVRDASRVSGFAARGPVRTAAVAAPRYATLSSSGGSRAFGLLGRSARSLKLQRPRARYDVSTRTLFVQRKPAPTRRALLHEVVRALIDQNYRLRRLVGLRGRDRDRWLAANAIVDGTAALSSHLRPGPVRGTPGERFAALEAAAGLGPGRALAAELRYLGGRNALTSALRTFPQTTEQLLHVDKFLERERALAVRLPAEAGGAQLGLSETFGELDVRYLLRAFGVPSSAGTADGWGGGKLALYGGVAVLVLRWDTPEDAAEWQAAVPRYVAAAFPGATPQTCPPLDRCWSGKGEVAAGVHGTTSVLASGPGAAAVGAMLLSQS